MLRRTGPIANCFEIGCNRGLNLDAIKKLMPACKTSGLEIIPILLMSAVVEAIGFSRARFSLLRLLLDKAALLI